MTPMGWVLENSKLSSHNDFRDNPHAQRIASKPSYQKKYPWPWSLPQTLALAN
jgi:hypothetical protein